MKRPSHSKEEKSFMLYLLDIGVSNALAATCLTLIVASITRFCRQPPVVFCLWLLVMIKLVTPPLFQVPLNLFSSPPTGGFVESIAKQPTELGSSNLAAESASRPSNSQPGDPYVTQRRLQSD